MTGCPTCGGNDVVLTRYVLVYQRVDVDNGQIVGYDPFDVADEQELPLAVVCRDCGTTWTGQPDVIGPDTEGEPLAYTATTPVTSPHRPS